MNVNLQQQQSLLKRKLIDAGIRASEKVPVDDYDSVPLSDAESSDSVIDESPYNPYEKVKVENEYDEIEPVGILSGTFSSQNLSETSRRIATKISKFKYSDYWWGYREWAIHILRTDKLRLLSNLLNYFIEFCLDNKLIEAVVATGLCITYSGFL